MFNHFDPALFESADFKEDSVREVIILPLLTKLGYHPAGKQQVVRSKRLIHPFIYAGTRRLPVTLIPDYTLYFEGTAVAVLDAKSPSQSVSSVENVQQAYSYAIHPEIRVDNFALCNGRTLLVYSVNSNTPTLSVDFRDFESRWEEIVRHLSPKYLNRPELRNFKPDFGYRVSKLGLSRDAELVMIGAQLNTFARLDEKTYSATQNTTFADEVHCISFDFTAEQLPMLVAGLPLALRDRFLDALSRVPFRACADLTVEVDLRTHLGTPVVLEHETFIPLVIDEVLNARFNPYPPELSTDVPPDIFRLSKHFKVNNFVGPGHEGS